MCLFVGNMKLYFVFVAFYLFTTHAILTNEVFQVLKNYQNDCRIQTRASEESIEIAKLDQIMHDNECLNKFAVCMSKKLGIISNDGSINQDVYKYTLISENPVKYEKAEVCKTMTGKNIEESARKIMTCLMRADIYVLDPLV